jgi:2,4-dienoyl-CoA reductase-like NADH-dependent reductase (Old Yellow Enzyme family)
MSILFTPLTVGDVEIRNRFVASACEDNLATEDGTLTDAILRKYQRLAKGQVGLIISSHLSVHPWGRARKYQLGIYNDSMIPGLRKIVDSVHKESGKIVFQMGHAGLSATREVIGRSPMGLSTEENPMNDDSIGDVITAFRQAAERTIDAGADGVQLHAAHGYLINEFLSPYFNRRGDAWGGSEENRFRLMKEIVAAVKKVLPKSMALLVKLNAHDHTKQEGITPGLAVNYAERLAALGIDGLEVSCGTSLLSPWKMCRGDIPVSELLKNVPESRKLKVEPLLEKMRESCALAEGYNVEAARMMRPVMGTIPLFAVGGWRNLPAMEKAVAEGETDLIPLCRPLIREPSLVRRFREGKTKSASCTSCNRCLIGVGTDLPVRCYYRGLPTQRRPR